MATIAARWTTVRRGLTPGEWRRVAAMALTPAGRAGGNYALSNCKVAIIASYRCEIGAPRAGPFVIEGVGDA